MQCGVGCQVYCSNHQQDTCKSHVQVPVKAHFVKRAPFPWPWQGSSSLSARVSEAPCVHVLSIVSQSPGLVHSTVTRWDSISTRTALNTGFTTKSVARCHKTQVRNPSLTSPTTMTGRGNDIFPHEASCLFMSPLADGILHV